MIKIKVVTRLGSGGFLPTVSRIITQLKVVGQPAPSTNTSAYCQARSRLPEILIKKLLDLISNNLEKSVKQEQLWRGRKVKIFDGSTVSMPDTKALQEAYPQHSSQKKGCGFPLARIVVLFSLTTGAIQEIIIDTFKTSELILARKLYEFLEIGDIWLSDRATCTYVDLHLLINKKCDAVIRLHASRKQELRKGKRIGSCDRLVIWNKPKNKPSTITKEEFKDLPDYLILREIHYYICRPGFRTKQVTLITTLLDAVNYSGNSLVKLYGERWEVELNLRHLKTTLGMDILRSKTPELARKEIYIYLLAYNLIRTVMWQAGMAHNVNSLRLSFQSSRNHFINFIPFFQTATSLKNSQLFQELLLLISSEVIKKRPLRVYGRVVKRRPKSYPRMNQSRQEYLKSTVSGN